MPSIGPSPSPQHSTAASARQPRPAPDSLASPRFTSLTSPCGLSSHPGGHPLTRPPASSPAFCSLWWAIHPTTSPTPNSSWKPPETSPSNPLTSWSASTWCPYSPMSPQKKPATSPRNGWTATPPSLTAQPSHLPRSSTSSISAHLRATSNSKTSSTNKQLGPLWISYIPGPG